MSSLIDGLNENKTRISLFDALYNGTKTESLAKLAVKDLTFEPLGYNTEDMDRILNVIGFAGKWGIAFRNICTRDVDGDLIESINKLDTCKTYFGSYINTSLPINFVIRRVTPNITYIMYKDIFTQATCVGVLDCDRLEVTTCVRDDDIANLIEGEISKNIFYANFGVDYHQ